MMRYEGNDRARHAEDVAASQYRKGVLTFGEKRTMDVLRDALPGNSQSIRLSFARQAAVSADATSWNSPPAMSGCSALAYSDSTLPWQCLNFCPSRRDRGLA
jgi:hypothetical protein